MINDNYKQSVAGEEIYLSIKKSKQKSDCKILIIGDSTGKQIFDNREENDSINSLACNQAIGVVGQYLLLNNYFNAGNKPEIVYMLYTPFSFKDNLDQVYTFHYFLKPFYTKEYKDHFSEQVLDQIAKIPFSYLSHEPLILTSNWAPDFKCKDATDYTFLSPISKAYLKKIKNLCMAHQVDFFIIPPPIKISNKERIEQFNKNEYRKCSFENELNDYFDNIIYLSNDFFVDDVHLKTPSTGRKIMDEMILFSKIQLQQPSFGKEAKPFKLLYRSP